jgi:hypothetical protein
MTSDIARMIQEAPPSRSVMNQSGYDQAAADYAFFEKNGMTRAQMAERDRQWAAEDANAELLAPVSGEPAFAAAAIGLSGARAMLARHLAWEESFERAIEDLQRGRRRLLDTIESPKVIQASLMQRLVAGAQSAVAGIIGEGPAAVDDGAAAYAQEKARQAAEEFAAETARMALPEIERRIDIATKRLNHLISRRNEWLVPVIRECAEAYAADYIKKLAAFRESASRLFAFQPLTGGFDSGWERLDRVTMPRPGSDVCKLVKKDRFVVEVSPDDSAAVRDFAKRLLVDPKSRMPRSA